MTEPEKTAEEKQEKKSLPDVGKSRVDRRNFMGKMIAGCGGLIGVELACSAGSFLATKPKAEKKPVNLNLSDLPVDSRKTIMYGGNPAEVIRTEKGFKALSLVCTHLGCIVIWRDERKQYYCPCHDGWFDADGNVTAGPPSMPLEKIPVRVDGNTVIVGEL